MVGGGGGGRGGGVSDISLKSGLVIFKGIRQSLASV